MKINNQPHKLTYEVTNARTYAHTKHTDRILSPRKSVGDFQPAPTLKVFTCLTDNNQTCLPVSLPGVPTAYLFV